jgi:hypothetical protein
MEPITLLWISIAAVSFFGGMVAFMLLDKELTKSIQDFDDTPSPDAIMAIGRELRRDVQKRNAYDQINKPYGLDVTALYDPLIINLDCDFDGNLFVKKAVAVNENGKKRDVTDIWQGYLERYLKNV